MLTGHRPTMSLIGFAVCLIEYSLCNFRQFRKFRIHFHIYAHVSSPDMSPTVFAVGLIGHSLCKFSQLAYLRLTIHKYSHMQSPDTVSDRFCRSLDRVFPMETLAASILAINNPQIYSLSIARHCLRQCLPSDRSRILSATSNS